MHEEPGLREARAFGGATVLVGLSGSGLIFRLGF
jgi:hypothetical protein